MVQLAVEPIQLPNLTAQDLIDEFTSNLDRYSWTDLFNVLDHEITPIVKVIVRAAIHSKERDKPFVSHNRFIVDDIYNLVGLVEKLETFI